MSAAAQRVFFEGLTVKDGLPSDYVNCVFRDSRNYLWVGTDKGACRYDGRQFIYFNNDNGLISNFVNTISEDARGNIWFGSFGGGINKYDGHSITSYSQGKKHFDNIIQMELQEDGSFYLISGEFNLFYCKDGNSAPVKTGMEDFSNISLAGKNRIIAVSKDSIVYLIEKKNETFTRQKLWSARSADERVIGKGKGNYFFVKTKDSLYRYRIVGSDLIIDKRSFSPGMIDRYGNRSFVTGVNTIWMALTNGLAIWEGEKKRFFTGSNGLGSNFVSNVCEDAYSNVFICTYGGGIKIWHHPYLEENKTEGKVNSISAKGSKVYFTTNQHLYQLDSMGCKMLNNVQANEFSQVYQNDKGEIYLGNFTQFWKFKDEKQLSQISREKLNSQAQSAWPGVSGFFETGKGDLVISTYGEGLYLLDNSLRKMDTISQSSHGLGSDIVEFLQPVRNGYAALSNNAGVTIFSDGKIQRFTKTEGLLSNSVYSIFQEKDDRIWIGTLNGVNLLDRGQLALQLTSRDGFFGSRAVSIFKDRRERMWVLSDQYLHLLSNGKLRTVRSHPLLYEQNAINRAAYDSVSDHLYIGMNDALLKVNMNAVYLDSLVNSPQLIRVEIGNKGISPGQHKLKLPPGSRQISFRFEVPYHSMTRKQDIYYKLSGFDDDWMILDTSSVAIYRKLPPGKYELLAKSVNVDFYSSPELQLLEFEVMAPFWQRGWFILVIVLFLLGGAIFLASRINRMQYEKKIRKMEKAYELQMERERIARELHDNVGSQLTYLINRIDDNKHKQVSNVDEAEKLGSVARGAMKELRDTIWALDSKAVTSEDLENKIRELILLYMDQEHEIGFEWKNENGSRVSLGALAALNVYRIVQEAVNNASKYSEARRIDIEVRNYGSRLTIRILDDGKGFDPAQIEKGYGLKNMEKRARELDALLEISSRPGEGTSVYLELDSQ